MTVEAGGENRQLAADSSYTFAFPLGLSGSHFIDPTEPKTMALMEQLGEDQVSVPAPNLRTRTNVGIHSSKAF